MSRDQRGRTEDLGKVQVILKKRGGKKIWSGAWALLISSGETPGKYYTTGKTKELRQFGIAQQHSQEDMCLAGDKLTAKDNLLSEK